MNASARALLAHAAHPDAPDSVLFARLIGARIESRDLLLLGLDAGALARLIERHFPGAKVDRAPGAMRWSPHWPFVRDLRGLLMWHDRTAARHREDAACLATIIAAASLRPDHLWRDLGLAGRDDVTDMLGRHYPDLVARNVANLRWKKFLAQEVAHARGVAPTCAPGCPGCEDYAFCYPDNR
ncbi:hydrogenase [Caballeronia novacaledonica]|uniref:Hydrogenase n=1 Tax=Caballeronia novacaledonica TaxID=1544861 RepID=A0A2U3I6B0_9BURK|nr:nitrogen fixation protein NifQ [Caballeronia novacaledonica]SPB15691.1 hydrogenase [Caballeronia novacaledonica]